MVVQVETLPAIETTPMFRKTLGSLLGGIIGDAIGTPCEGKTYEQIEQQLGWVDDLSGDGTDDTVMKNLLATALIETDGMATYDDWAQVILDNWDAIFGSKMAKFFLSVLHMAHKLRRAGSVPRMVALGNMPSSSSAMCISPVGIVNAGDPRAAAAQAYSVASLIHIHDVGFCQDGAAAMAAAVAAAYQPGATVDSILDAAVAYIPKWSGAEMLTAIDRMLGLARETNDYRAFRSAAYADAATLFCRITCDSRETVPLTLAFLRLSGGDVEKAILYAANFGRDADTTASMVGAIVGALHGVGAIRPAWVEKIERYSGRDQVELATALTRTAIKKHQTLAASQRVVDAILSAR
jgi:ADP-ribosylglycohydrolase